MKINTSFWSRIRGWENSASVSRKNFPREALDFKRYRTISQADEAYLKFGSRSGTTAVSFRNLNTKLYFMFFNKVNVCYLWWLELLLRFLSWLLDEDLSWLLDEDLSWLPEAAVLSWLPEDADFSWLLDDFSWLLDDLSWLLDDLWWLLPLLLFSGLTRGFFSKLEIPNSYQLNKISWRQCFGSGLDPDSIRSADSDSEIRIKEGKNDLKKYNVKKVLDVSYEGCKLLP